MVTCAQCDESPNEFSGIYTSEIVEAAGQINVISSLITETVDLNKQKDVDLCCFVVQQLVSSTRCLTRFNPGFDSNIFR